MKKYMGNKSRILQDIFKAAQVAPRKCTIFDAFSGTTNVGQYFKSNGYSVISNDVNTTSRLLGNVYLMQNKLPTYDHLFSSGCKAIKRIKHLTKTQEFIEAKNRFIELNHNTNDSTYLSKVIDSKAMILLVYLSFYANQTDLDDAYYQYKPLAPDFIWSNYCKNGYKSKYFNLVTQRSIIAQITLLQDYIRQHSSNQDIENAIELLTAVYTPPFNLSNIEKTIHILKKSLKQGIYSKNIYTVIQKLSSLNKRNNHIGNRMFFSEEHGHRIDVINTLNLIWFKDGLISMDEYNFIQCALIEAVALFSNTSATYQAFYKTYRANTMQDFRLVFPELIPSKEKCSVYCEDTFNLVKTLTEHYDIMYLDPPYNWRIYDSNYHLLNLLSDFISIADNVLEYESGIAGAAGENRNLKRDYTNYNRRDTFEDLLFKLIESANCQYILLSYSDSLSNHNKNSLSSIKKIETFLSDPSIFRPESYKKISLSSINFESRRSEQKEQIHELLFVAEKRKY